MTSIVVAGSFASNPGNGGEAWVALSWLRGLADAGFDVRYVEALDPSSLDRRQSTAWFREITSSFGLAGRAALWCGGKVCGANRSTVKGWLANASLLVDLSGHLALAEARGDGPEITTPTTLFVDLEPGFTQVWHETGISELGRHDHYASVGLLIGTAGCKAPDAGRAWLRVPPFVVLDDWPVLRRAETPFTTVSMWKDRSALLRWNGWKYGSKHHTFRSHRCIPALAASVDVELAIHFDPRDDIDRDLLIDSGFRVTDPSVVAGTPAEFRRYVQRSSGEWSVADGPYVGLRTGWIGDRTVRYLASGRPAVVQDTGVGDVIPVGEGLIVFNEPSEAAEALQRIAEDWDHHSRVARELAEQYFSADAVLPALLAACDVEPAVRSTTSKPRSWCASPSAIGAKDRLAGAELDLGLAAGAIS